MSERSLPAGERPHIVVLGLMGVGKSTAGRAVAAELDRPYLDSDEDIERLTGESGRSFAQRYDVATLHRLEAAVLLGALARSEPSVISAAASVVDDPLVRRLLPLRAVGVRLHLTLDQVIARQRQGGHRRAMDRAELEQLARRREPLFAQVEDVQVDAGHAPERVLAAIVAGLDRLG